MALNDLKLTFRDEFDTLSLDTGTRATDPNLWNSTMYNGTVRTLSSNGEKQWYVDPDYKGKSSSSLGINPFEVKDGVLTIKARPTPSSAKSALYGYNYTSGVLTTQGEFSQKYGYFEMRAQVPEGKGLWPAFWLLADHGGWPPEIDVMEILGHDTKTVHQTTHTKTKTNKGVATKSPTKLSDGFHTYGVDWTKDKITFYLDGKQTWSRATPADMHTPMYMLVNMAVGGNWPGSPNASTNFAKADYKIDYVRAYQHTGVAGSGGVLPPAAGGAAPSPQPAPAPSPDPVASPPSAPPPVTERTPTDGAAPLPSWGGSHVRFSNAMKMSDHSGGKFDAPDTGGATSTTYRGSDLKIKGIAGDVTATVAYTADKDLTVRNNGAWDTMKNVQVTSAMLDKVTVSNFIAVDVRLTGNKPSTAINVYDAKRGNIVTKGFGNDTINVVGRSNTENGNLMRIDAADGTNLVAFSGASNTRTEIKTGINWDVAGIYGEAGGTISTGRGRDRINIHTTGRVTAKGGADADVFSIIEGAHATIADFQRGSDRIEVKGVGAAGVRVRTSGTSTLIDLNGKTAATLTGVSLSASSLNLEYA